MCSGSGSGSMALVVSDNHETGKPSVGSARTRLRVIYFIEVFDVQAVNNLPVTATTSIYKATPRY